MALLVTNITVTIVIYIYDATRVRLGKVEGRVSCCNPIMPRVASRQ
jgi:hypothetical protein